MDFNKVNARIQKAAQTRNYEAVLAELNSIIAAHPGHYDMGNLSGTAFSAAIDVGDLELVKKTYELYQKHGKATPMANDPWCVYRAAHRNHLDVVKFFMTIEYLPWMMSEIAYSGAINNNIKMMQYALANTENKLDLLWDRSGPLKSALAHGCIKSARFLIGELRKLYPGKTDQQFRDVMRSMAVFYYGMNCAKSSGYHHMVDFINSKLGVKGFFSKSTGMEVSAPHLTDEAMAATMSGYRR